MKNGKRAWLSAAAILLLAAALIIMKASEPEIAKEEVKAVDFTETGTSVSVKIVSDGTKAPANQPEAVIEVNYPSEDIASAAAIADTLGTAGFFVENAMYGYEKLQYRHTEYTESGGKICWMYGLRPYGRVGSTAEPKIYILFMDSRNMVREYAEIRFRKSNPNFPEQFIGEVTKQVRLEEKDISFDAARTKLEGHAPADALIGWGPEKESSAYQVWLSTGENKSFRAVRGGYYNHKDGELYENYGEIVKNAAIISESDCRFRDSLWEAYAKDTSPFLQYLETAPGTKARFSVEKLRKVKGEPEIRILRWPVGEAEKTALLSSGEENVWKLAEEVSYTYKAGNVFRPNEGSLLLDPGYYYDILVLWQENGHGNATAFHFITTENAEREDADMLMLN